MQSQERTPKETGPVTYAWFAFAVFAWASELVSHPMENGHPHHVDMVWPFWNLLDMTPDGRGELSIPIQNYEHTYFSEHVLGGRS